MTRAGRRRASRYAVMLLPVGALEWVYSARCRLAVMKARGGPDRYGFGKRSNDRAKSAIQTIVAGLAATILVLGAKASAQETEPSDTFRYRLLYSLEAGSEVRVEIRWGTPLDAPGTFVMPRAIPMGYGEQPYDRFLRQARAFSGDGVESLLEREEGPRWLVPAGSVGLRYAVDLEALERKVLSASDQSRRREGYVGLLGYSVFGYLEGRRQSSASLLVEAPSGWPIHATLGPSWPVRRDRVEASAANFYALADSQIAMGPRAEVRRLIAQPVPVYLVSYAEGRVDLDVVGGLAATAFERVLDYFVTAPFEHYTLHLELLDPISDEHEYGFSMEHLDSSTYYLDASRGLTEESTAEEQRRFLYNFAHHIVHSWVPKRAHGHGYFPFSWELAPVLDTIWFSEGFGQYAAAVAVAAGEDDPEAYREWVLSRRFRSNLASAPQFLRELSLVELSRVASTRYGQDFRTGRLVFSRGGLMAAEVDDTIRAQTGGERSLRDALRYLVDWTEEHPFGFDDISDLVDLIEAATGADIGEVVDRWLAPLP